MNSLPNLEDLNIFVQVAKRASFAAVAEQLGMSAAFISKRVRLLEQQMGVRLLHRTTRRLALTDAGEQALKTCREMVSLAGDIVSQASQAGEVQGRLRLTSAPSFAHAQLTAAVVDFQTLHPKVEIDLVMVDRTVDLVQDRIDLAIRVSQRIDDELVARRLAVCHSVLCASPAYLARAGTPATPEDLAAHKSILHSHGFAASYNLRKGDDLTVVQARGTLTANETSIVLAAALAGAGIAMLPTYYVGEALARGTLQVVLPDYALDTMNIHAVYLSRRHQPLPLRLLIEFLAERFGGEIAPWDRVALHS